MSAPTVLIVTSRYYAHIAAELEAGVTTYDEIYGARGIDWRSALEAKAQQAKHIRDLASKYGIDVSEISVAQKLPIAPEPALPVVEDTPSGESLPEPIPAEPPGQVIAKAPARRKLKAKKKHD